MEVGDIIFLIVFNSHLPALYSKLPNTKSTNECLFIIGRGFLSTKASLLEDSWLKAQVHAPEGKLK